MTKHLKNNRLTFNEQCYALLSLIPKGKVTTYKAIAEALETKAYQAVGNAMAANPNPIKVPCHRVVNSNGAIGNYAFGVDKKIELLQSEGVIIQNGKVMDFKAHFFDFK
ncbi:MGMT family protein [Thiomicrorhabdus sp. Kp2]|uniref:MGMT family protein n=1 Tax=Thiomicrorhabdus sp. Kp2 TaxID=1123518 RepID=UPI0004052CAB|nr:MGMT family protein [Thiomicrorhabdus sp. Kp2]